MTGNPYILAVLQKKPGWFVPSCSIHQVASERRRNRSSASLRTRCLAQLHCRRFFPKPVFRLRRYQAGSFVGPRVSIDPLGLKTKGGRMIRASNFQGWRPCVSCLENPANLGELGFSGQDARQRTSVDGAKRKKPLWAAVTEGDLSECGRRGWSTDG